MCITNHRPNGLEANSHRKERNVAHLLLASTSAVSLWITASGVTVFVSLLVAIALQLRTNDDWTPQSNRRLSSERRIAATTLVVSLMAWTLSKTAEWIEEGQIVFQMTLWLAAETLQLSWAVVVLVGLVVTRGLGPKGAVRVVDHTRLGTGGTRKNVSNRGILPHY
jgi:hypothetical protein